MNFEKILKDDLKNIKKNKNNFFNIILKKIIFLGIKQEEENYIHSLKKQISDIKGVYIDNFSKSIFYKSRSPGCALCVKGTGCTVVLSYRCNRDCFFCYEETPFYPQNKIDPYNDNDFKKIINNIDISFSSPQNKSLAITGGEPFLFKEKVYSILEYVNKNYPGKYKRIYSNGDLVNEDILIKLNILGLDEIRYSIKPFEKPNLELYKLSKKYIRRVLIEMPVFPGTKDYMIDILSQIDKVGVIDGINLNELTFNGLNIGEYKKRGYKLDIRGTLHDFYLRYYKIDKFEVGVYGSRKDCLEIIEYFAKKEASFFMHYCDIDTVSKHNFIKRSKVALSLNIKYSQISNFGIHQILAVYGDYNKIIKISNGIDNNNYKFIYDERNNFKRLETTIKNRKLFSGQGFYLNLLYKTPDYKEDLDLLLLEK